MDFKMIPFKTNCSCAQLWCWFHPLHQDSELFRHTADAKGCTGQRMDRAILPGSTPLVHYLKTEPTHYQACTLKKWQRGCCQDHYCHFKSMWGVEGSHEGAAKASAAHPLKTHTPYSHAEEFKSLLGACPILYHKGPFE